MAVPKAGQRLQCARCGTEVVVVKPPEGDLRCCGETMANPSEKGPAGG